MFRDRLQFHDGSAVEKGHVLQAVECGHRWARTRVDEDLLAGEYSLTAAFQSDEHGLSAGEAGFAEDQLKICGLFNASLTAIAKDVHDVALTLPDAFHVHADDSGVNAIANASPREIRHAAAGDHGFRWRATFVDTGSAHMLAFYQRRSKAGTRERHTQRSSTLAGTDNDRLVLIGR